MNNTTAISIALCGLLGATHMTFGMDESAIVPVNSARPSELASSPQHLSPRSASRSASQPPIGFPFEQTGLTQSELIATIKQVSSRSQSPSQLHSQSRSQSPEERFLLEQTNFPAPGAADALLSENIRGRSQSRINANKELEPKKFSPSPETHSSSPGMHSEEQPSSPQDLTQSAVIPKNPNTSPSTPRQADALVKAETTIITPLAKKEPQQKAFIPVVATPEAPAKKSIASPRPNPITKQTSFQKSKTTTYALIRNNPILTTGVVCVALASTIMMIYKLSNAPGNATQ